MYNIGILGTENSHAAAFIDIFNGGDSYQDIKVVAVGGHYAEANIKLSEKYSLDIVENPEDILHRVDAVMVTSRDGKYHADFVRPFIEAGKPAFIDKPVTIDPTEALALARLAKEKNVPLYGGSSLKLADDILLLQNAVKQGLGGVHGGSIYAPIVMNNEYGGFFFYSSHLSEMSMTVFGYDPKSVLAFENNNNVTAVVKYDSFSVTNHFMNECGNSYFGIVCGREKNVVREIDISLCYKHECDAFVSMLRSGKSALSLKELIMPVYYMDAIEKSYKSGLEVSINMPEI